MDSEVARLNGRKGEFGEAWHAREITGEVQEWHDRSNYALTSRDGLRRDNPATDLARQWQGWGTALKPAWEPIVVARKPLIGTVAENVARFGTGALNIDGCRVAGEKPKMTPVVTGRRNNPILQTKSATGTGEISTEGRWPANLCLSYPEDEYELRPDVTAEQRRELFGWLHDNA